MAISVYTYACAHTYIIHTHYTQTAHIHTAHAKPNGYLLMQEISLLYKFNGTDNILEVFHADLK